MEIRVITLRYSSARGIIDEAPLLALAQHYEVALLCEHFFMIGEVPHLVCMVRCLPRVCPTDGPDGPPRARAAVAGTPMPVSALTRAPAPVPNEAREPASTRPQSSSGAPGRNPTEGLSPEQRRTFETIRRWRHETSQHGGVPPYVVLTNRELLALVRQRPQSLTALREVRGIGKAKVTRYGEALLAMLHGEPNHAVDSTEPEASDHA